MRFYGRLLASEAFGHGNQRSLGRARLTKPRSRFQAWDVDAPRKPFSPGGRTSFKDYQESRAVETRSWAQEAWPSAARRQRPEQRPWLDSHRRPENPRGRTVPSASIRRPDEQPSVKTGPIEGGFRLTPEGTSKQAGEKAETDHNKHMLVISGVSTNLTPSDFHRLAPKSLSAWNDGIKMVTQLRCAATLKPKGCYLVTFANAEAATTYSLKLQRLQAIARWKCDVPNGLWEATLPAHLHSPEGVPAAQELSALTVVTPSQPSIMIQRKRTSNKPAAWQRQLQLQLEAAGHGTKPPTVILEMMPGRIHEEALRGEIEADGAQRGEPWDVADPIKLPNTKSWTKAEDHSTSRFAIVCETEWEARRFQRYWNGRTLPCANEEGRAATQRRVFRVAMLNW